MPANIPVETDTRLAALYGLQAQIISDRRRAVDDIHVYAGDRKRDTHLVAYNRAPWGMSLDEAIARGPAQSWDQQRHAGAVGRLGNADRRLAEIAGEMDECNQIWKDYGCWSRFFLVQAGHIHSSMSCSTCNNGQEPTMFGWLPDLSGLTEGDAVKAHGALLCTVCFPSAPVEWTNFYETEAAAKKAAQCPGSRQYVKTERWDAKYARCPECGSVQSRTTTGKLRAHKPPTKKES